MKYLLAILTLLSVSGAWASDDTDDIKHCLAVWQTHPFGTGTPKFRTVAANVRVMGIGGELTDTAKTDKPELVLIKPSVTVMAKTTMTLANPNGWYCLKGKVEVMGKSEINLNCKAHLASASGGAVVGGTNNDNTGVTVFGKSTINRIGCTE